ncbi:hypothetical protein AYI69_g6541 [Smittium culicis]|uniref:Uncharacterized protein n=1 Tax=Smittium culicis TaxID=133412 RepID=A0A1R1XY93_9FUNG|nr:hypothetical protein AYI69_g7420 [Smittium culicis]OMJ19652.1 hypothetical protein AYI69_g6541 [Smittium culicis]
MGYKQHSAGILVHFNRKLQAFSSRKQRLTELLNIFCRALSGYEASFLKFYTDQLRVKILPSVCTTLSKIIPTTALTHPAISKIRYYDITGFCMSETNIPRSPTNPTIPFRGQRP